MPIIQCDIREGRSPEQKAALAEAITKAVHDTIGSPVEWIYALIRETPAATTGTGARPCRSTP